MEIYAIVTPTHREFTQNQRVLSAAIRTIVRFAKVTLTEVNQCFLFYQKLSYMRYITVFQSYSCFHPYNWTYLSAVFVVRLGHDTNLATKTIRVKKRQTSIIIVLLGIKLVSCTCNTISFYAHVFSNNQVIFISVQ